MTIRKSVDSVVAPAALNFPAGRYGTSINGQAFQQDAVASHLGYQYATYFDGAKRVCVARRKLPADAWEIIRFEDYQSRFSNGDDIHNVANLGICPGDGTIHLAFDHHCEPLHYRISKPELANRPASFKWEASLFGKITSELEPGQALGGVTYPYFLSTPQGALQLFYRDGISTSGDRCLFEYDPGAGRWRNLGIVISRHGVFETSTTRGEYPHGLQYDARGRLHLSWCWWESASASNANIWKDHDLMYAYSDDGGRTWLNNAGAVIRRPGEGEKRAAVPIGVDSPGVAVQAIPIHWGMSNCDAQAVDGQGRVHVVLRQNPPEAPGPRDDTNAWRYVHYWRDTQGKWRRATLPFGGGCSRAKLVFDPKDNAWLVFRGGPQATLYHTQPGKLILAGAGAEQEWSDWRIVHQEAGSFAGEPLVDHCRWRADGALSVYIQQAPESPGAPSALRVLDFALGGATAG